MNFILGIAVHSRKINFKVQNDDASAVGLRLAKYSCRHPYTAQRKSGRSVKMLDDTHAFIDAQPVTATGRRGVHVSNATVRMAREITNELDKALKTLRLPLGRPGAYGTPYLPLRWPEHRGRKEALMVDGIDRAR
jgi:hypothetical protein